MAKSRFRYILPKKEQRMHLVVSPEVHALVQLFAKEQGITITEATFRLLGIAFRVVYNLQEEDWLRGTA